MSTAQISNIRDWRKVRTRQIATRSGLAVTLRRDCSVEDLMAQGTIPLPLVQKIQEMGNLSAQPMQEVLDAVSDLMPAINAVCCAMAHSPRILPVDEHRALVAEAAEALGVDEAQLAVWLVEEGGEAHLAGLPEPKLRLLLNSVSVGELDMDDRMDIFSAVLGEGAALARFPGRAAG